MSDFFETSAGTDFGTVKDTRVRGSAEKDDQLFKDSPRKFTVSHGRQVSCKARLAVGVEADEG